MQAILKSTQITICFWNDDICGQMLSMNGGIWNIEITDGPLEDAIVDSGMLIEHRIELIERNTKKDITAHKLLIGIPDNLLSVLQHGIMTNMEFNALMMGILDENECNISHVVNGLE